MPVEALAAFVVDQALGIVVGAAVVVVAPAVVSTVPAATGPVMKTRRIICVKVAGGAQWYGGKWIDLVTEAQAKRASRYADTMTLAGVLASLPEARVVSDIPGRARLRVKCLKGRASRAQFTADALMSTPGIRQVKASSYTGGILIYYDAKQYDSLDSLLAWIVAE